MNLHLIIATALFAYFNLLVPQQGTKPPEIYIQFATRLLIISLGIYLISFCFKQFSINKHLSTINKHKENTLNTYKLFISSLSPEEQVMKNAIMVEVAKSIYDVGNTGYLTAQGQQENSPSIIEMTKFVSEVKGK